MTTALKIEVWEWCCEKCHYTNWVRLDSSRQYCKYCVWPQTVEYPAETE